MSLTSQESPTMRREIARLLDSDLSPERFARRCMSLFQMAQKPPFGDYMRGLHGYLYEHPDDEDAWHDLASMHEQHGDRDFGAHLRAALLGEADFSEVTSAVENSRHDTHYDPRRIRKSQGYIEDTDRLSTKRGFEHFGEDMGDRHWLAATLKHSWQDQPPIEHSRSGY